MSCSTHPRLMFWIHLNLKLNLLRLICAFDSYQPEFVFSYTKCLNCKYYIPIFIITIAIKLQLPIYRHARRDYIYRCNFVKIPSSSLLLNIVTRQCVKLRHDNAHDYFLLAQSTRPYRVKEILLNCINNIVVPRLCSEIETSQFVVSQVPPSAPFTPLCRGVPRGKKQGAVKALKALQHLYNQVLEFIDLSLPRKKIRNKFT